MHSYPNECSREQHGVSFLPKDIWHTERDRTKNLPVSRWPALPPEVQPPLESDVVQFIDQWASVWEPDGWWESASSSLHMVFGNPSLYKNADQVMLLTENIGHNFNLEIIDNHWLYVVIFANKKWLISEDSRKDIREYGEVDKMLEEITALYLQMLKLIK